MHFLPPLGAGDQGEEGNEGARQLRQLVSKEKGETEENAIVERKIRKFTKAENDLLELAISMGFMLVDTNKMKGQLANAIASRLQARSGDFVYQCSCFTLTNITRQMLDSILPESVVTSDAPSMKKWSMLTVESVNLFLPGFLSTYSQGFLVAGNSRALKTVAHPWVRVLATCYQLSLTFYDCPNSDKLMINVQYVLIDQHGELHPPKDFQRNEIALAPHVVTAIREQAMADLVCFYQTDARLSAGFLRQLGEMDAAMVVEALESNADSTSTASSSSSAGSAIQPKKTFKRASMFNVEMIVRDEMVAGRHGYWVQWEGYHPSWEAWRVDGWGQVGYPLVTWEPRWALKGCRALQDWQERHLEDTL